MLSRETLSTESVHPVSPITMIQSSGWQQQSVQAFLGQVNWLHRPRGGQARFAELIAPPRGERPAREAADLRQVPFLQQRVGAFFRSIPFAGGAIASAHAAGATTPVPESPATEVKELTLDEFTSLF